LSLRDTIDAVADYITIVCGINRMVPYGVDNTYLPGIAREFDLDRIENYFREATHSIEVKLVMKGFKNHYSRSHPEIGERKVAFGLDLALSSKQISLNDLKYCHFDRNPYRAEIYRDRLFLVMVIGIMFLLRCSEHIESKVSTLVQPVLRQDFIFRDKHGHVIPYDHVGNVPAESVTINIKFSKTDHAGFGRRPVHYRQNDHTLCPVCLLEKWFKKTKDIYGAPAHLKLYEVPGFREFKLNDLHQLMHATVLSKGVPSGSIKATSHSLRYGGATMMAAAGFPQYLVAIYGGWTEGSKSLRIYTKPSEAMARTVSQHMIRSAAEQPSMMFLRELMTSVAGSQRV
jgi:hypothetical protein